MNCNFFVNKNLSNISYVHDFISGGNDSNKLMKFFFKFISSNTNDLTPILQISLRFLFNSERIVVICLIKIINKLIVNYFIKLLIVS